MKFRIIASILVIIIVVVLIALFGNQSDTFSNPQPSGSSSDFSSDAINSMRQ